VKKQDNNSFVKLLKTFFLINLATKSVMIARTNLEDRLKKHRSREISEADLLDEIKNILDRIKQ
jgi:hypothetical protein